MKDTNTNSEITVERIVNEAGVEDVWVCICRNTSVDDGFYPCDEKGIVVEPLIGGQWVDLYVCFGCGRIINQNTLEVVGVNTEL